LLTVDGWNVTVTPQPASGNALAVVPDTAAQAVYQTGPPATRINCGGSLIGFYAFADTNWLGDTDYDTGTATSTTATIATNTPNAAPEIIYQSERYGSAFTYTIPAAGSNFVRLHFAEVKFGPGGRQFNVAINSQQVLTNFDIAATGGMSNAVVETFLAAANASSNVVIYFTAGAADLPKVCGIEVVPVTPTAPRLTSFGVTQGALSLSLSLSATNGPANGACYLMNSPSLALPLSQWTPVLTNTFDSNGNLNLTTNILNPGAAQGYYFLLVP
jgi:hypothetical protein